MDTTTWISPDVENLPTSRQYHAQSHISQFFRKTYAVYEWSGNMEPQRQNAVNKMELRLHCEKDY